MSTWGDVLERTRTELLGGHRATLNRLASAASSGATTLTLEFDASGVGAGSVVGVGDELFHVWSVAGNVLTVVGARGGTAAAAHALGDVVEVNPLVPRWEIRGAMAEEIRSWPNSLFRVADETAAVVRSDRTTLVTLATAASDVRRVVDVRHDRTTPSGTVGRFQTWPRVRHWEAVRGLTGDDTLDLQIRQRVPGSTVWVRLAKPFDLSDTSDAVDMVATVGLTASMEDIVRMGAIWRLVPRREIGRGRTDAQGAPRDAAEVQAGQNLQAATVYKTLRDQRIAEEASRLRWFEPEKGL